MKTFSTVELTKLTTKGEGKEFIFYYLTIRNFKIKHFGIITDTGKISNLNQYCYKG